MKFNHIGIVSRDEASADSFFQQLLGLRKTKESVAAAGLCEQLFSIGRDMKMINYENEAVKFEVFIAADYVPPAPNVNHACLMVDDLESFLEKTSALGLPVIKGEYTGKSVRFIKDFSGNMYEVKQG